jgi:lipoprotein NlpI
MNRIDLAIADFSEAIKLKPSAEIYTDRGLAYAQTGKVDLALADYAQAIQLNPKFGRSYVLRGLLVLQAGQVDAAQKDFDTGFGLDPRLHAEFDDIIKQIRTARGLK